MDIFAGGGYLNVALNVIGNRNTVHAEDGFLNFAVNAGGPFSFPNGSDNNVTATGSLSAALNSQTFLGEPCPVAQCGNTVTATGPLSLVVAAGVVRRLVEGGVGAIEVLTGYHPCELVQFRRLRRQADLPPTSSLRAARRETASSLMPPATTPMASLRAARR